MEKIKRDVKKCVIMGLAIIGVISTIAFMIGFRPVILDNVYPNFEAINIIATIVLGILTLLLTVKISNMEYCIQKQQTKLSMFELRFNVYESLEHVFSFANMLKKVPSILEYAQKEDLVDWFDESRKNHSTVYDTLIKSQLLFAPHIAKEITYIAVASTMLFINLRKIFESKNDETIDSVKLADDIENLCTEILRYEKSLTQELESVISLEEI